MLRTEIQIVAERGREEDVFDKLVCAETANNCAKQKQLSKNY
jgi:hypothetical protein